MLSYAVVHFQNQIHLTFYCVFEIHHIHDADASIDSAIWNPGERDSDCRIIEPQDMVTNQVVS